MKIIYTLLAIFSFLVISCTSSEEDERFLSTYKEILIARETTADSVEANRKVRDILNNHGYTEAEFREKFFEIATEDEEMVRMIDSLRNRIAREADSIRFPEENKPGKLNKTIPDTTVQENN